MKSVDRLVLATTLRKAAFAGLGKALGGAVSRMLPSGGSMTTRLMTTGQGRNIAQGMQQAGQKGMQLRPLRAPTTLPNGQPNAATLPALNMPPRRATPQQIQNARIRTSMKSTGGF